MALPFKDLLGQDEFWALVFIWGAILLNWPLLALAQGFSWMGIPGILIYLTAVWLAIILLLYLSDRGHSA
jgi:hypothetical protein